MSEFKNRLSRNSSIMSEDRPSSRYFKSPYSSARVPEKKIEREQGIATEAQSPEDTIEERVSTVDPIVEPEKEEPKTFEQNVMKDLADGNNEPAKYISEWEKLTQDVRSRDESIHQMMDKQYANIRSDEEAAKKKEAIGTMIKSLMNAAALVYAAKRGIQSDIKMADPENAEALREIERDYDLKRVELAQKVKYLKRREDDVTGLKKHEIASEAASGARAEKAQAKLDKDKRDRIDEIASVVFDEAMVPEEKKNKLLILGVSQAAAKAAGELKATAAYNPFGDNQDEVDAQRIQFMRAIGMGEGSEDTEIIAGRTVPLGTKFLSQDGTKFYDGEKQELFIKKKVDEDPEAGFGKLEEDKPSFVESELPVESPKVNKDFEQYRSAIKSREESPKDKNKSVNRLGYLGSYQLGSLALQSTGYVKFGIGASNSKLQDPENWTGRDGINSMEDYLNSVEAQDNSFDALTKQNLRSLKNRGVITPESTKSEIYGHLAGSHLLGAAGYAKNANKVDANDVTGQNYYDYMQKFKWGE